MTYNETKVNKAISFWHFIQEHTVEIPIIQRDYAQGRLGEEYLRYNFLINLKQALDDYLPNEKKVLILDFVYGSQNKDNPKSYPLDGQQRLTTLWLFHWYIALKAGNLEKACDTLKNSLMKHAYLQENFAKSYAIIVIFKIMMIPKALLTS